MRAPAKAGALSFSVKPFHQPSRQQAARFTESLELSIPASFHRLEHSLIVETIHKLNKLSNLRQWHVACY
jgi:hypothetical protein